MGVKDWKKTIAAIQKNTKTDQVINSRQIAVDALESFLNSEEGEVAMHLLSVTGETFHIASETLDGGLYYVLTSEGLMDGGEPISAEDVIDFMYETDQNRAMCIEDPTKLVDCIRSELDRIARVVLKGR